jgi:hypothetical protein
MRSIAVLSTAPRCHVSLPQDQLLQDIKRTEPGVKIGVLVTVKIGPFVHIARVDQ